MPGQTADLHRVQRSQIAAGQPKPLEKVILNGVSAPRIFSILCGYSINTTTNDQKNINYKVVWREYLHSVHCTDA